MKRKKMILLMIIFSIFFISKNTYAFDINNYRYKSLCGTYEVAGFHTDGVIDPVYCTNDFNDAKNWMRNNGAKDLAVMTKVNGQTKILDANIALLDLSVNPETLTYFFGNSELTGSAYTYMDTGSLYGGVDGVLLDSSYSNAKGVWTAKVKIGNYTGWITQAAYEVVPITWIKSSSSYSVTDSSIRHNYVAKIQNTYSGSSGRTIGPKPDMLSVGTYYSYDGHYFYNSLETLIKDYKNGNYNNSVNKNNEYYNYYMYLSNHTKTSYSSLNIDEYIRNNMGIKKDVFGNASKDGSSRLYGSGTFFYYAQQKYGVNAVLSLSLSRNETGNGTSSLAVQKNNGFGLNAVDSNPIHAANWYPTFASSILGYASKWVTDGYAYPNDWRYFGPQFGDKLIGMNVKYASDTYWSEKMASNYYSLDLALGLQDYNYYQLGVVTGPTNAYKDANTSSKLVYKYPEKEDAVVIVDEVTSNGEKWYKLVSDLNVNSNYDYQSGSDYNWNAYVYVKASQVKKINKGKNGYITPNSVTDYQDSNYSYNLLIDNKELSPKVGISTNNIPYYYDSSLTSKTGSTLLKDRYVMIYAIAYDGNGRAISYLVSSDYWYSQKHWVSADSIKQTNTSYGKVSVTASGNQYTWVNYNTEDAEYSKIGGLYTNSYVPVLEQKVVNGNTWYKVPVSLTTNDNVYGWTLAQAPNVSITLSTPIVENNPPVIEANDKTIIEGDEFNPKENIKAYDTEDGDLTNKIEVVENKVDTKTPGNYKVTYKVTDSNNASTSKTITVTVKENKAPVINAKDKTIKEGDSFKELDGVKATDEEDGDITKNIKVKESTVDTKTPGVYKVIYEVTDSKGKTTTKEIKVTVEKKDDNTTDDDKKDDNTKPDDSDLDLDDLDEADGMFYLDYMKVVDNKLQIKGYNTINGINNDLDTDIEYYIMYYNIDTEEYIIDEMNRIEDKKEITRPVFGPDDKEYTYSWFKYDFNLKDIENGNYILSVISMTDNEYSANIISNSLNKQQVTSFSGDKKVVIRNNYNYKESPVELIIRDNELAKKTASSYYNQFDTIRTLEFSNNKLHVKGLTYSYGMNLGNDKIITRKIIFENQKTYKTYSYDLGYTINGLYEAVLPEEDNLSKEKAWYDKTIDLNDIPKGTYTIYITTSSNITDISELPNSLNKDFSKVKATIDNKKYSFNTNFDRDSRIELIVE